MITVKTDSEMEIFTYYKYLRTDIKMEICTCIILILKQKIGKYNDLENKCIQELFIY